MKRPQQRRIAITFVALVAISVCGCASAATYYELP